MPNIPAPKPVFIEGEEVDPSLLTAEERAGFDEFEDFDPDAKLPAADDEDGDGDGADDDDSNTDSDLDADDGGDDGGDDDTAAKPDSQELPDADDGADDDPDDNQDAPASAPTVFRLDDIPPETPPETSDVRLQEIAAEIAKAEEEFEDGGLTTTEFRQQIAKLEREAGRLEASDEAKKQAYDHQVNSFNSAVEQWKKDCAAFYKAHLEYKEDPIANRDLNDVVRSLQGTTKGHIYDPAIIEKAHELLQSRAGRRPASQDGKESRNTRDKPRTAPRNNPPNLGGLPVSDAGDVSEGEFSRLDALLEAGRTAEYETALAQMTDAQRARYEAQG